LRIDENQQTLSVKVDNKIPDFIIGDDQYLAQVITNLISNAIKFTPNGGSIHLDISLSGKTDESCELRFEVADSGIGISPEKKEKLFQPFEQAESGTSREYGGTGLGLTISKRIIELMGGTIWIESELGKGSRFMFTIKVLSGSGTNVREDTACIQSENNGQKDGEFKGKRMLLAEDIAINREILIALLENTGIIIETAENGKEALDMMEAGKYDIIFMDVQMPKMDGYESTRLIRRTFPDIPIIAMTANVFKDDIEACIKSGMNDHLGKPLDIEKIFEKLRKYLV
jgi:CheY-like chemotaxis protein